jgi:hypothetical protein
MVTLSYFLKKDSGFGSKVILSRCFPTARLQSPALFVTLNSSERFQISLLKANRTLCSLHAELSSRVKYRVLFVS